MFLNNEFTYSGGDWNDGTKWAFSLTESIEYSTEFNK